METHALELDHPFRIHLPLSFEHTALESPARGLVDAKSEARALNNTLGWDTVFAVPASKVNQHFSTSGLYPTDFASTVEGAIYDTRLSGDFGAFQIAGGGTGSIVRLRVPIVHGTMNAGTKRYDLAGAAVMLQVKMHYLPQPSQGDAGTPQRLLVRNGPMNETGHVAEVTGITIPNQTDPTVLGAARSAFQRYFDDNLDRITYIFNTVNVNAVAASDAFQWLQPTYTTYAYHDAPSLDRAVFGILNMVGEEGPGTNAHQIDLNAIPSGAESALSITAPLFMRQMVLPTMGTAFGAANGNVIDESYFRLKNHDTQIVNTKNIPMAPVKYGGVNYHPECIDLQVTVQGAELVIYTRVHVGISPGIDAYVEQTTYYGIEVIEHEGQQYLSYFESSPPVTNQWTEVATWVTITSIVVGIIGTAALVVLGALGQTVKYVVAGIIIAVVAGVAAAIPTLLASVHANGVIGNVPSIRAFVTGATDTMAWTGGQAFQLTMSQLNGTLQLGGVAFPDG